MPTPDTPDFAGRAGAGEGRGGPARQDTTPADVCAPTRSPTRGGRSRRGWRGDQVRRRRRPEASHSDRRQIAATEDGAVTDQAPRAHAEHATRSRGRINVDTLPAQTLRWATERDLVI